MWAFVRVRDAESGRESWVDTASVFVRELLFSVGTGSFKAGAAAF
jgi:hypothetical protein